MEEEKKEPKMREIIIETNGNDIKIVKLEIAGVLEFRAILSSLLDYCNNPPKK
jgi:hypothetical protein